MKDLFSVCMKNNVIKEQQNHQNVGLEQFFQTERFSNQTAASCVFATDASEESTFSFNLQETRALWYFSLRFSFRTFSADALWARISDRPSGCSVVFALWQGKKSWNTEWIMWTERFPALTTSPTLKSIQTSADRAPSLRGESIRLVGRECFEAQNSVKVNFKPNR